MLRVGVGEGGHGLEAMAGMVASAATQAVTGGARLWRPRGWLEFSQIVYEVSMVRTGVFGQFPPMVQQLIDPVQH